MAAATVSFQTDYVTRQKLDFFFNVWDPVVLIIKIIIITPWSKFLLDKQKGSKPVMKFPAFHVNRRLISVLTRDRRLSLSWARSIQSLPLPSHFLKIHFNNNNNNNNNKHCQRNWYSLKTPVNYFSNMFRLWLDIFRPMWLTYPVLYHHISLKMNQGRKTRKSNWEVTLWKITVVLKVLRMLIIRIICRILSARENRYMVYHLLFSIFYNSF